MRKHTVRVIVTILFLLTLCLPGPEGLHSAKAGEAVWGPAFAGAAQAPEGEETDGSEDSSQIGGGYAVTGQLQGVGYTTEIFDAQNGLPTSDANCIMGASDGYLWIGGYSGIFRYDGSEFRKMDASEGMTSGRGLFEDSQGRIWIGTNDNGVVVLDHGDDTHLTYKEGLPSSSIRSFAEDEEGNIYIGTTAGVCWVDAGMKVAPVEDERLSGERVLKLQTGPDGLIYGQSKNGRIFSLEEGAVRKLYRSQDLQIGQISTILPDPEKPGRIYIGTQTGELYYGHFGDTGIEMKKISAEPLENIHWLSYDCGRVWAASTEAAGFLDEDQRFHLLRHVPMDSGIEMMTSDYQGNMWFASSTQGVMKVVSTSFQHITEAAGLPEEVVNTTCLYRGDLYIGTDSGLRILDEKLRPVKNALADYIGGARVRCIMADTEGNLWVCTYTDDLGLVCLTEEGEIRGFTTEEGLPHNEVRCVSQGDDGSVLAATNGGLAVLREGKIVHTTRKSSVVTNTVFLTVCQGEKGRIYAGTDGDGIYVIDGDQVSRLGREDGLTSDVIWRIRRDEARGIYWLITSNSIQILRDGRITQVSTFPNNSNYDVFFDKSDHIWIISSYGVYVVDAQAMLEDDVRDYRLYTLANGLTGSPTSNAYSEKDGEGNLYISARSGVCRVNIDSFFEERGSVRLGVSSMTCQSETVQPEPDGSYVLPASRGRIRITPAVLDYTLTDPTVHVYLEGSRDGGITARQSELQALEFTDLGYGDYDLHVQLLDDTGKDVVQEKIIAVEKPPRLMELTIVRVFLLSLLGLLIGFIVWFITKISVQRRQREELRQARQEAWKATQARNRFLSNISHEIRSPIVTIVGMDEMILREETRDVPRRYAGSVREYAMNIRDAAGTLLGLIDDLLEMSRLESNRLQLTEYEYGTENLFRAVAAAARRESGKKDLTFEVDVDEMLPARLYGDGEKIKQILLHLLGNAVKYTHVGGICLTAGVSHIEGDVCTLEISVRDTGLGMKAEEVERLFSAYERLSQEGQDGTGSDELGISVSKRFADLMGGRIRCQSEYGEGTEFTFTVDQKIVEQRGIGAFREWDPEDPQETYVPGFIAPEAEILVVDDNPMNRTIIRGFLKETQMFVTTAVSGTDCMEKLKYGTFDLVLLDYLMPGMDGVETIEEIRKSYPDLPVYAMISNPAVEEGFYESKGFNGCLVKPVDGRLLEETIMRHLPQQIMMKPEEGDGK